MAKQNARKLLVDIESADTPGEYEPVGGLATRNVELNGNLVDITSINTNDPGGTVWREVIAGVQSMNVNGTGYFENAAQYQRFIAAKNDGDYLNLRITMPTGGTYTAAFAVGNIGLGGEIEGAITQSLELQSSGEVTFTPSA